MNHAEASLALKSGAAEHERMRALTAAVPRLLAALPALRIFSVAAFALNKKIMDRARAAAAVIGCGEEGQKPDGHETVMEADQVLHEDPEDLLGPAWLGWETQDGQVTQGVARRWWRVSNDAACNGNVVERTLVEISAQTGEHVRSMIESPDWGLNPSASGEFSIRIFSSKIDFLYRFALIVGACECPNRLCM